MKTFYLLLFVFSSSFLAAQKEKQVVTLLELQPLTALDRAATPFKTLCDPLVSPIEITFCEGEDRDIGLGDNEPSNGAYMTWDVTGSNNLYYSRIYSGTDTFTIVQGGTSNSVYEPDDDGNYSATLAIGGNTTNQCLEPGTWTVQVWDVIDLNGDLLPDRDANGRVYLYLPALLPRQPTLRSRRDRYWVYQRRKY